MDNKLFGGMELLKLDISYTAELASSVQAQINEDIERTRELVKRHIKIGRKCNRHWSKQPLIPQKQTVSYNRLLQIRMNI